MVVSYIYDTKGQIEYAVIPYSIWDSVKEFAANIELKTEKKTNFEPSEFIGMLSHYNFDVEAELNEMRKQLTRDLL